MCTDDVMMMSGLHDVLPMSTALSKVRCDSYWQPGQEVAIVEYYSSGVP